MTVTELIKALEAARELHGTIPVKVSAASSALPKDFHFSVESFMNADGEKRLHVRLTPTDMGEPVVNVYKPGD